MPLKLSLKVFYRQNIFLNDNYFKNSFKGKIKRMGMRYWSVKYARRLYYQIKMTMVYVYVMLFGYQSNIWKVRILKNIEVEDILIAESYCGFPDNTTKGKEYVVTKTELISNGRMQFWIIDDNGQERLPISTTFVKKTF